MLGSHDESTFDRIVVNVVDSLQHHLVADNRDWMEAFLPDLPFALQFVGGVKVFELVEQPFAVFFSQLVHDFLGGEPLEIAHHLYQIGGREDGVEVIVEDNPGVHFQALLCAAVVPRLNENVAARGRSENGQPRDNCRGDELRVLDFADPVATAHWRMMDEAKLLEQARSEVQLRNEEN